MIFRLPGLVVKFIEAFIYPDHAFGTEIVFLHGDVEEASVFSFVQQSFGFVVALRAKAVPGHGFFRASEVCGRYTHLDHLLFKKLDLKLVQVDEVMGIPDVP